MIFLVKKEGKKKAISKVSQKGEQLVSDLFDDIIESYGLPSNETIYFIAKKGNKWAIYKNIADESVKITDDFDWIEYEGLVSGKSNYFIAKKNKKFGIYQYIDRKVLEIISGFDEIYSNGLVQGKSSYFIAKKDGKWNIYEYEDGKVQKITDDFLMILASGNGLVNGLSNYFAGIDRKENKVSIYIYKKGKIKKVIDGLDDIYPYGLLSGESNFFKVKKDGKYAIYEYRRTKAFPVINDLMFAMDDGLIKRESNYFLVKKDDKWIIYEYKNGKIDKITDEFDELYPDGLVKGQSNFIRGKKDDKWAIYEYKNGNIEKITGDFDEIFPYGLTQGKSRFFRVKNDGKESIFEYKDGEIKRITDWFDFVYGDGLIEGQSEFFKVKDFKGKWVIYRYKDGIVMRIMGDFDWIDEFGLIQGQSDYFIAKKDGKWSIYRYKDGKIFKGAYDFDSIEKKHPFEEDGICLICTKNNKKVFYKLKENKLIKIYDELQIQEQEQIQEYKERQTIVGEETINIPLNLILYGTSGTGKTYRAMAYAVAIIENKKIDDVLKESKMEILKRYKEYLNKGQIEFVVFHPSYTYENFIEVIRTNLKNNQINYYVEDGIFKRIVKKAMTNKEKKYVTIIDEINRADIPRVFGELIVLLDKDKRDGNLIVELPFSNEKFSIPSNLYIIGTMDGEYLSQIETFIIKAFEFEEVYPNIDILKGIKVVDKKGITLNIDMAKMVDAINSRIESLGANEQIGEGYFFPYIKNETITLNDLNRIFKNKIIPFLQRCFDNNWHKIRTVLNDYYFYYFTQEDKDRISMDLQNLKLPYQAFINIYEGGK